METPKVSVIIPTYNYGHLIGETIQSVLAQTLQNWEAIIVDDGSTDDTPKICECINDARIKYVRQDNLGLSAARNTGIEHSLGDYIQLLDADDLIQKNKLKVQSEYLDNYPEVDLIYGEVRYFYSSQPGKLIKFEGHPDGISGSGKKIQTRLLDRNIMTPHCAIFRRALISDTCRFNTKDFSKAGTIQDWEFWLRLAMNGARFQYVDNTDTFALYRFHSYNASKNFYNFIRDVYALRNAVVPYDNNLPITLEENQRLLNRDINDYLQQLYKYSTYISFSRKIYFQYLKSALFLKSFRPLLLFSKSLILVFLRGLSKTKRKMVA